MVTPEEYFGEELSQLIRELMIEAWQSTVEERSHLVVSMRTDAANQQSETVRTVLLKIAERVESMEGSE